LQGGDGALSKHLQKPFNFYFFQTKQSWRDAAQRRNAKKQMKHLPISRSLIALMLLLGVVWSCKKDDPIPAETCKLSTIDRGNGNKHTYAYDANGKLMQMTREFDGTGSGKISKYVYSFTYDAAGLLSKSVWTLGGKADGSETCTYTNGKISKVSFAYSDGSKGVNNIKCNAAGRIIEFTVETGNPNSDGKQYFEYDANGITTKRGFADLAGLKLFEIATKPVGLAKSPEQLLAKYGLPHDPLTGYGWSVAEGGEGTVSEVFYEDNGKLVFDSKYKTTVAKTNTKGYLTEITDVDDAKVTSTSKFTMTDCN